MKAPDSKRFSAALLAFVGNGIQSNVFWEVSVSRTHRAFVGQGLSLKIASRAEPGSGMELPQMHTSSRPGRLRTRRASVGGLLFSHTRNSLGKPLLHTREIVSQDLLRPVSAKKYGPDFIDDDNCIAAHSYFQQRQLLV